VSTDKSSNDGWADRIHWTPDGLLPAIVQDHATGKVLMLAWMNQAALQRTRELGEAVYWSRSRAGLWHKGEMSGHVQRVIGMYLDCDGDTLLLKVAQTGGIACHTGRQSCFFSRLDGSKWVEVEPVLKDPAEIYGKTP
jgi:phosphoribosyl-AMP cyclohydrolase